LLFSQALFDKLTLKLGQASLQKVAIALNITAMRSQASRMLFSHLMSSFDDGLIPSADAQRGPERSIFSAALGFPASASEMPGS
jgi:hypothetical protein